MSHYPGRVERARDRMASRDVEGLLLSIGPELPYLTGYEAMDSERLTMLVIGQTGPARLVVPELEAPRVAADGIEVVAWSETDDPIDAVVSLLGPAQRVAIGDRTRARFVLGLQNRLEGAEFENASHILDALRIRKDPTEIEALRTVAAAADRTAVRLSELTFAGRSELAIAADVASLLREEGHETVEFTIVATGPNGASPHHEPSWRLVQPGDAIVLDFGGRLGGYHSDTTRNVVVGDHPQGHPEVHELVRNAHAAAAAAVRPGVAAQDVDRAARRVIEEGGLGDFFIHRTGHGIGLEGHEAPYLVEGNEQVLEPGMTFSIEPGVYLPERYGVRIEDIAVVTDTGVELLNTSPHDCIVV